MGGGGHDDHHPHLMWDTTTPWNPMGALPAGEGRPPGVLPPHLHHCVALPLPPFAGAPLAILTGIVVGGLGTIAFAISFSQSQFLSA
jgi:hypothetical protein